MMPARTSGGDNAISCRIAEWPTAGKLPSLTVSVGAARAAVARSAEAAAAARLPFAGFGRVAGVSVRAAGRLQRVFKGLALLSRCVKGAMPNSDSSVAGIEA
jgi:hypothetical protein